LRAAMSSAANTNSLTAFAFAPGVLRQLSGEADNEYFVDGITEDIIAALSRFRWFFVIGRNAAFAFKQRTPDELAQALAVRYVLAGSVRKSGNRIRIVAELVDARTAPANNAVPISRHQAALRVRPAVSPAQAGPPA
jgi:TolB-like protein